MNDFDDFDDPQLRSTLQRAAGQAPDLPAAFAAVSSRAARIRRRRTVVVAASSLGLVVAAVAIVARPLDHDVKVTPGTDVNHVSTTVPVTTSPTTPTPRLPAPPATPAVTNPIASGAPGTSVDDHGSGQSGTSAGTNAAGNETRIYSSEGGSVTVRLQNGAVRIVAGPSPRGGFQASVSDRGPDRVRVEFATSGHRSRITVTVQDGHLVARVSESGSGTDDQGGSDGGGSGSGGGSSGGGSSGGGSGSGGGSSDGGGPGGAGGGGSSSGGGGSDGGGGGSAGGNDHGGDTPGGPDGDDLGSHGGHG